jgi:DNA-binding response OmpR family regulator
MMNEKKVLVVDDEAQIREMLETALSKAGYTVHPAPGAEEAFKIIAQEEIPVMFIDLGLEAMNGFELCENIRKSKPDAIIFALTGYAGLFGPQDILEAGFDDYFAKPIRLKDLYEATAKSFEKLAVLADRKPIEQILIVDDDDQFRRMLRRMLESEGYAVSEAANGVTGLKSFLEAPVDLVITDIIMPKKEGVETMMEIMEADSKVKFIVVSGGSWYGSEAELEMVRSLGARTLKKPFRREEILHVVKQLQS